MRDLLDAAAFRGATTRPSRAATSTAGCLSAFDAIEAVRRGPNGPTATFPAADEYLRRYLGGTLQSVSWIVPDAADSDHPGEGADDGPQWIASIVNAVGKARTGNRPQSSLCGEDDWAETMTVANLRKLGYGGLGFQQSPRLIVSAYAKQGYCDGMSSAVS